MHSSTVLNGTRQVQCDLLVIGAGPAGSACEATAARAGLDVLLVDKASFPRDKLCGDFLAPGAVEKLKSLGVDEKSFDLSPTILKGTRLCYGRHDIWMPFPATRPGWAMGRAELDGQLLRAAGRAGARVMESCRITSVIDHGVSVVARGTTLSGAGLRIEAAFIVDAGGRNALLPGRLGWRRHSRWPARLALGAWFEGVEGLGDRVEMHVLRCGYVGIAPLPGGRAGVAAVFPLNSLKNSTLDPEAFLLAALHGSSELSDRFSKARALSNTRGAGPLAHGAGSLARGRLLIAGDAVAFVDPFTGEGVQAALTGGESAARAVAESFLAGGAAIGTHVRRTPLPIRAYERATRRRQGPRHLMARSIQTLLCTPILAEPVARALAHRPDLAAALVEVTGGLREPSSLLASSFFPRMLGEILLGTDQVRDVPESIAGDAASARKPIRKSVS